MNPGLKQRLVGAIVLVALAVIFLPMLLDGSGAREQLDEEIAIPDEPEPPESHLDPVEPSTPDPEAAEASSADSTASGEHTQSGTGDGDQGGTGAGQTTSADDAPAEEGDTAGAADGAEPVDEGWVVQVGSFRRETNAIVLRDRLREEGFDADAERAEADDRTVWRVLVGPVAERAEGESLKRRIEQLRGEQALLMSYP